MVRNGYHAERVAIAAAGAVPARAPRVNDQRIGEVTGERGRFSSSILPAWAHTSPQVAEASPLLYQRRRRDTRGWVAGMAVTAGGTRGAGPGASHDAGPTR